MALNVKNEIFIAGEKQQGLDSFCISQEVNSHNHFEVVLHWEKFLEGGQAIIEKSQEVIGQKIEVTFINENDGLPMSQGFFEGIITGVSSTKSREGQSNDRLVISGSSPTICMDHVACCKCYEEKTTADIVNDIVGKYGSGITAVVEPVNTGVLPYTVQYNQSDFKFIQQLAVRKGEWFYHDGTQLVFGNVQTGSEELKLGLDLVDFNFTLQTKPKKAGYVAHDYFNSQDASANFPGGTTMPGYYGFTAEKSETVFAQEGLVSIHQSAAEGGQQGNLDALVNVQSEGRVSKMVVLSGHSRNTGLKPGGKISILHKTLNLETEYGVYIVTKVIHKLENGRDYSNIFEAIPEGAVYPPYTDTTKFPQSEPQRAKVVDNNDPQKMGRIRVQFVWQQDVSSPWLRVAQPHGGSNKGFYFIPETGEEVMVGFEAGNAELPFVMGSLYNGNAKAEEFTTDTNDVKVIRTRSGHTIELNDTDGEEKINIYDNEGSIITFDTASKSLIINSAENIDIAAKNINISAEENIVMGAKGNIDIAAKGDLNEQAKGNIALQSDGDTMVKSMGATTLEATKDATVKGMNLVVEGTKNADLKGGVQTNVTGTMTAVKGAAFAVEVR
ncbi:type VI secretion system Vgr family protein [Plebeiibacterium marinum]|uniref:Type VI secretion system tip protein VgrG n=1 Tax=Plebeiibacterium marinum TaxID=2992111 RepID=A0AAE3SLK0_9BACT|nr:type VI secretion system tip protein VgrG [Plebeiobacterium marinum]MCW3807935.1 type VI secretion system tip protein VgrG [Plebeiobacterium marinum]